MTKVWDSRSARQPASTLPLKLLTSHSKWYLCCFPMELRPENPSRPAGQVYTWLHPAPQARTSCRWCKHDKIDQKSADMMLHILFRRCRCSTNASIHASATMCCVKPGAKVTCPSIQECYTLLSMITYNSICHSGCYSAVHAVALPY